MPTRSYSKSLLQGNCPRCRTGNIFIHPITHIRRFTVMNEACPVCRVRLEPEPGFYQGAMYVGYGITVACMIVISLLLYMVGNPRTEFYIGTVIAVMILIAPANYRYSRIIYLYLFGGIRFDSQYGQ